MIYLKLRQNGLKVNHKRVDRLYTEDALQIKRRKRKEGASGRTPALAETGPD
jgi:putative transposase